MNTMKTAALSGYQSIKQNVFPAHKEEKHESPEFPPASWGLDDKDGGGGVAKAKPGKAVAKTASKAPAVAKKSRAKVANKSVKPKILMIFTRQLATLIDAGLPLLRGLMVLEKQERDPVLKATIAKLSDAVQDALDGAGVP